MPIDTRDRSALIVALFFRATVSMKKLRHKIALCVLRDFAGSRTVGVRSRVRPSPRTVTHILRARARKAADVNIFTSIATAREERRDGRPELIGRSEAAEAAATKPDRLIYWKLGNWSRQPRRKDIYRKYIGMSRENDKEKERIHSNDS